MFNKNSHFFENLNRNSRNFFKIPLILPFFSKINPYKQNQINEANGLFVDKQWVIWYREFTVWAIDVHINGFLIAVVLSIFNLQPLVYSYVVADGLSIWLVPKVLSLLFKPFVNGAKEIARELPRK